MKFRIGNIEIEGVKTIQPMYVKVEISNYEAGSFHQLMHHGLYNGHLVDYRWIDDNLDKFTYCKDMGAIEQITKNFWQLTDYGKRLKKAFGNWQPPTGFKFSDEAFNFEGISDTIG